MDPDLAPLAVLRLIGALFALLPAVASAHHQERGAVGGWDIVLALLLGTSALWYAWGLARLWRRAGAGRGVTRANAVFFSAGWVTLTLSLAGPVDTWSERSFALHMIQHEVLMVIAAPLLVLGRPLEAWAWVLRWRRLQTFWRPWARPGVAFAIHAAALWLWHLPAFFDAALQSEPLHVLQHASFFLTALAFWGSVLHPARAGDGASLATLFATMLHTSVLGALLTFAPTPWYPVYAGGALGLTGLEDQQMGGLVMWVPAGLAYVAAGLWIVSRWLVSPAARPSLPRRLRATPARRSPRPSFPR